jgi:hypothetical protein
MLAKKAASVCRPASILWTGTHEYMALCREGKWHMSLFEIRCPMCKGTLWVDPSSGKVVDHKSADHQKADLGEFMKTHKDRGNILEDQFKKAKMEKEKHKQEMDKKFKDARKLADDFKGDVSSPFGWD